MIDFTTNYLDIIANPTLLGIVAKMCYFIPHFRDIRIKNLG